MTFFGIKSIHLTSVKARNRYCTDCDNYDTIVLNAFIEQLHLFDIPLFPMRKTGNAFCQNCKRILQEDEMPELIKHQYLLLKNGTKGPAWQIPGSIVLLLISLTLSLAHKKTNQRELEYLASPLKGDVYAYKIDNAAFSTMKINRVTKDSIFVFLDRRKLNTPINFNWLEKSKNYSKNTVAFERQKINDMFNEGEILEIHRKSN